MNFLLSTLSISFVILMPLLTIKSKSFTCNTAATCDSIIDYVTPNATTLSAISTLFDVGNHSSLLEANNLSLSTSPNQPVPVRQTTKIPFPCICSNGTGTSDRRPLYKVLPGDYLYHIAVQVFSGLVTFQEILAVHNIPDANLIYVGQVLWIPLPCSCDDVDGEKVVHYGHLVSNGSTLSGIAKDYNTTVATLLKLNGMASPTDLMAGSVLDVPIKVDDSNLGSKKNIGKSSNLGLKMAIGIGAPASVILLVYFIFCIRKFFSNKSETDINVEAFIRQYGSTIPKIYKYSDIKNITNSFKEELGKGGYGNVYKGKLLDGRLVAVKVLNTSKGSGDEFINEVASIGKTFHVNVVTLLGFCYEGKKRALIYEFMPNGSLEKFIYSSFSSISGQHLGWEKLYDIALGIARGLDYLHRGCNTPILHLDIKPHNILLDEDLCPKISDFGLAKLNTRKGSMVSMMEARGTIGYIAPEVFSRNFGGVSHKSDVYSYGMMVLEMVGGRKNVDVDAYTSESYFPHWIYKRIELDEELSMEGEMSEEDNEIARKMVVVGLWCIQTHPSQRPSASKVIEMLEGSIAALKIPPKPYLCSSRSGSNSSARPVSFSLPKSELDSFTT